MTYTKRIFDLLCAVLLALILVPVIVIVAIVVLILDGRPIFYVSERMRGHGQPFQLWKLRTLENRQGLQTGCLEEIAYDQGWINEDQLRARAKLFSKNAYGQYLLGLLD